MAQEAVLSRAKAIFLGELVQASGLGAVANQPTLRMILAADLVRAELWKEHCAAIRQPGLSGMAAMPPMGGRRN